MPTHFLKDRVMTNTCLEKTEMPPAEEGQIQYVRNELYSAMAHFKYEHHISENNRFKAYLSHRSAFSQKEARTKFDLFPTTFRTF